MGQFVEGVWRDQGYDTAASGARSSARTAHSANG
jgi:hypothetical protein